MTNDGSDDSLVAAASVMVTPVNDAPLATPQSVSTNEDLQLAVTLAGSDVDGDALTASLVTGPANGGLTLNSDGSFDYTPAFGFVGTDSFTYRVHDGSTDGNVASVSITVNPSPSALFYFSLAGTANLSGIGVTVHDEDIVAYSGTDFQLLFDGSDLGLDTEDINAFSLLDDGSILMSFTSSATIVSLGEVDDSDIVRFVPVGLGDQTMGVFEHYFDGSDVGLSTGNEDIDSLEVLSDGTILVSTKGTFDVPGAVGFAEDLIAFSPTQLGATTTGTWSLHFDGSDVELSDVASGEELDAAAVGPSGKYYFSFVDAFAAGGTSGADEDVVEFVPSALGDATAGSIALFMDGSEIDLGSEDIDGLHIPSAPPNQASIATNDSYTTDEDTTLVVSAMGVLANDSDADGDSLTANLVSGTSDGTLTLNPNGSLSYTPNADFNGTDSFSYQVNDGTIDSSVATAAITVTAINDAPAANDLLTALRQNSSKLVVLAASDAAGDSLTYHVVSAPVHGTLTGSARNLTYTPNTDYTGSDNLTFVANDGTADSNLATISFTVTPNNPPVADPQSLNISEDTPLPLTLTGSDADGDALSYSVVSGPSHGALSGSAPNLIYTPAADYSGPDSFAFKVNDGSLDSPVATVAITVLETVDTKFYVPDSSADEMFEYQSSGALVTNYDLGDGNSSPKGAATTATGDTVWVVDKDDFIYVYDD